MDDLANLCVFLMNNYSGNETVNAGTRMELTIKALTELVAKVVGYEGEIKLLVSAKKSLVISGISIFSDSRYTGRTSSLLVAVKGQNMPQNSKYSHPRLCLCRVRDGIFSGQPLLPLNRGLVFRQKTNIRHKNMFNGQ